MMTDGATWARMVAEHARSSRRAVVSPEGVWTFRELTERAEGWAAWLDAADFRPGGPLPILIGSTPQAYAVLLAGALTGRPLAPLGDRLTVSELSLCLDGLGADVVLCDAEHAALADALAERTGVRPVLLPSYAPPGMGVLDFGVPGDAIAVVLHTSGTTGNPKPVRFRMDRLGARTRVYAGLLGLREGDVYASAQQFHHVGGSGMLMVAMGVGAAVTPPTTRFSSEGWKALGALGVTHATLAPTMIERLLAEGALVFPGLRMMVYGAASIRPTTVARALAEHPELSLVNGYSQTEGGPITALTPTDHRRAATEAPELLKSVGRPVGGTEVVIHAPDEEGVGEIWARAEHLAAPQADGWLHTGDLGRLDEDGYLFLVGRKADMIIRGGENVYPEEVERRIVRHPGVAEVAVVGLPHDDLGEEVAAFVVAADGGPPPEAEELRRFARAELSGFKVPTRWQFVDELPRGALGKIVRRRLRADTQQAR
jgi:acyl-CoA synthetase (AMP-forming)/AMP-acid ligase II